MGQVPADRARRLLAAAQTLGVDVTTAEVLGVFREAECRSILVKGPAIAGELYEAGAMRYYSDTDLLVAPADLERAGEALSAAGFTLVFDHGDHSGITEPHAQEWGRDGLGRSVDLHWRFPGIGAPAQHAWEVLAGRTEPIVVAGAVGETLDRAGLALLVALHAAHHGTMRSTPLSDLERAVDRLDMATWEDARSLATRLEALEGFAAGLRLTPEGAALARALDLPDVTSARVRLTAAHHEPGALGVLDLLEAPTLRARLRVARAALVPPPSYMRAKSALARRGRAGLVLAYLARAVERVGQLPRALRAVRRARRPLTRAQS
jgi:hypothetical protein